MTILKIDQLSKTKKYNKIDITLECDECHSIYMCESRYKRRAIKKDLHFCSLICSRKSLSDGKLRFKKEHSMLEKFGSISFAGTDDFKNKIKEHNLKKYGIEYHIASPEIREKIKKTNLEKYGKISYTGTEDHKSKLDYDSIAQKAWRTKIKNNTCSKSKIEEKLYTILINEDIDVQRQVPMIRQWIDFYLPKLNLYIRVDGVYWHGLNRSREIIAEQKTSQDKKIYKQILRDEKLNQHMKDNNLKILRMTDEEIAQMSDEDILLKIKEF